MKALRLGRRPEPELPRRLCRWDERRPTPAGDHSRSSLTHSRCNEESEDRPVKRLSSEAPTTIPAGATVGLDVGDRYSARRHSAVVPAAASLRTHDQFRLCGVVAIPVRHPRVQIAVSSADSRCVAGTGRVWMAGACGGRIRSAAISRSRFKDHRAAQLGRSRDCTVAAPVWSALRGQRWSSSSPNGAQLPSGRWEA
jgi:hypothetical protein